MRQKPIRILLLLVGGFALTPPVSGAGSVESSAGGWCGTHGLLLPQIIERHLHNESLDRLSGRKKTHRISLKTDVRKEGNVGVAIDNSRRMVRERNLVDFDDGFSMQFKYKKKRGGYQVKRGGSFNDDVGEELPLTDDDSFRIDLPFKAKVFGQGYDALFVNSDGNITFGAGDSLSIARDVTRFLEGPPRLAPFFADLNPETAPAGGGIFAKVGAKSIRVTWVDVPKFDESGSARDRNTFQVTLARNGKITYAFGEMESAEGIVGVAPGGGSLLNLLDYSEQLPAPVSKGAIAESFSSLLSIDEAAISRVFLENFADRYMTVVVFTDFPFVLLGNPATVAYEQTVKNDVRGIGEDQFDATSFFGSEGALESFVMMGDVKKYGDDIELANQLGGVYSPLDILMHEIGHRWGVRLRFDDDGEASEGLLGRGQSHWSFCFNSETSYLEGNKWADSDGDGIFEAVIRRARFNDFDLYSMGLIDPAEVEPSFLIGGGCVGDLPPSFEGTARGEIIDVAIADVVSVLGERRPAFGDAPTKFEIAFLLVVKAGEEPRPGSVAMVDAFRKGAQRRIAEHGGRFVTKLRARR